MSNPASLTELWTGRIDSEDAELSIRLHQQVQLTELPDDFDQAPVVLGYGCDEGVRRNQGVQGAAQGPSAIRSALANLACSPEFELFDAGDVVCVDENLEDSQQALADKITDVLERNGRPFVLGGGHEMAWAGFLGCQQFLQKNADKKTLGILNFDAHFDLRNPEPVISSGTPFRQAHEWSEDQEVPFHYAVFGINPSANTDALFGYAFETDVTWVEDLDCNIAALPELKQQLRDWLKPLDYVYVTLCMDVFPAAFAPGVSAPAAMGVDPVVVFKLLQFLVDDVENTDKKILLVDVAETNPTRDPDQRTAKLAARYLHQMMM